MGVWMAAGVAGLVGLEEEKGVVRRDQLLLEFVEAGTVKDATDATVEAAVEDQSAKPDPDLPVDANFYFFLFVCALRLSIYCTPR